jgi:PAS domain S-box-containing protein
MVVVFKQAIVTMKALIRSCSRCPSLKEGLFLLVLTLIGLFGNYLNIQLYFGVNLIFGSIATMIAVRVSGTLWGTLVAIAIGSYTYVLWGHPYAIIIFGLEAFFVGFVTSSLKKDNMVLIDVFYWLLVGVPLVSVLYFYQVGVDVTVLTLIAAKQMVNGITNVAIACFLIQFTPLARWIRLKQFADVQNKLPMFSAVNTLLALFILLPMFAITIISGRYEFEEVQNEMSDITRNKAEDAGRELSNALYHYSKMAISSAKIKLKQEKPHFLEKKIPGFGDHKIPGLLSTHLLGANGEILFAYPNQQSGIFKYADQIPSVTFDTHYLSTIYVDARKVSKFTLIVKDAEGLFLAVTFTPKVFENLLAEIAQGDQNIQLIDNLGTIVANSHKNDSYQLLQSENPQYLSTLDPDLPVLVRWQQSYWEETARFIGHSGWSIRVVVPMKNSMEFLENDNTLKLLTMLIVAVIGLLLIPLISTPLSSPLRELTRAADMLTNSIERTDILWPKSKIKEVDFLVNQLKRFVQAINEKQHALSWSEAQQALIANNLTNLIDTANAPIFGIDAQGKVNEWNQQAEKITGFNKQEVMGRDLVTDFIEDAYKVSVGEVLAKALQGEETANYEFPLFTKTGDRVDVLLNSTTRRDASSQIIGVVGVGQDITELNQVRLEQEIERKAAAAQIIQSSKLATLGEMATSVAHELNQPLNVIRMAAGNGRRKISNDTADLEYLNDKLERIEEQTARAAAIISHMRMFGRNAKEDPESVDPRNVVTNALELMGEQLRLSGIEIVTELAKDCAPVLGHAIQMEQVILNLLTNARDAMVKNDGEATITLRVFEDDQGVHITSEDTGGGIPKDVLPRIFEPFYTTKEMGKGTGLGLSVSYGIVHDMNGTIVAENINDGVRFTITLPIVR